MGHSDALTAKHLEPRVRYAGRAAEYVRMSTEDQRYSTANQHDAIEAYAIKRGLNIVRTYADSGKSGLDIAGRPGLRQLISDVESGAFNFSVVLVYDVSRWGRFQDADEGAYYEHVCKRAGITIQYCAEQFDNDYSISATIIKSIKRAMAGEYSRELSVKVFVGKTRLAKMGVRQGGKAGYGLRRQLIDPTGRPKMILNDGDLKSLQTDRVVLVPGPPEEIKVVQWIYRTFTRTRRFPWEIASELVKRGVPISVGRRWNDKVIREILRNEKYIGNHIWNRTSVKLKSKRVWNKPEAWIRFDGAFEPIVSPRQFMAAQRILKARTVYRFTSEDLLRLLGETWKRRGRLSSSIIDAEPGVPCAAVYWKRFGSLLRAYEKIGYNPSR